MNKRDNRLAFSVLLMGIALLINSLTGLQMRCDVNDLQEQVQRMGATDGGVEQ